jgi:hypothetical protein
MEQKKGILEHCFFLSANRPPFLQPIPAVTTSSGIKYPYPGQTTSSQPTRYPFRNADVDWVLD